MLFHMLPQFIQVILMHSIPVIDNVTGAETAALFKIKSTDFFIVENLSKNL